jgi:hydrogenase maturation protein HypF
VKGQSVNTYHIHFEGIVQGVGFRPFVFRYAKKHRLNGWVNNTNDGVHIHINGDEKQANSFFCELKNNLPPLAVITRSFMEKTANIPYHDFEIAESKSRVKPRLLLTPDVAMCNDCRNELHNGSDRRFRYPFITCTNCGPRYSIINGLPYDRPNTTMAKFKMCKACDKEYNNPLERRHFSQTNSCPRCAVEMQLYENGTLTSNFTDLDYIVEQWHRGKIIAIKGIGGYLLTCDAANAGTVALLRKRKHRPVKPFALMYPDTESINKDVFLSREEEMELKSIHAPIVLLRVKDNPQLLNADSLNEISHGLLRLGIMLPYTPLYDLLLTKFRKPVIATSGNITDSTIIYRDDKAVSELSKIADIILLNNRDIVVPQDDGVVQFGKISQQKVTLRRSRGKAPAYINPQIKVPRKTVIATGSMLKSVFGLLNQQNMYISQYLGNTESYDARLNYEQTFRHFEKLFSLQPDAVIVDKHPDYFSTRFGEMLAKKYRAQLFEIQHHKAHFYSVLGENNLLNTAGKILGVIWDGTGLGDDGNIWGGEFFIYENGKMAREHFAGSFDFILSDKMVREPRIALLSMVQKIDGAKQLLKPKFTDTEWQIYNKLLQKPDNLQSSSMGRMFDAAASLLFGFDIHSFEAEASMKLESKASQYFYNHKHSARMSYLEDFIPDNLYTFLMQKMIADIRHQTDAGLIAAKFHVSLVDYIIKWANCQKLNKVAFSGGVFQNALLVDIIHQKMRNDFDLFFQKEFSPNDEGIPFGQLMYYIDNNKNNL